MIGSTDGRMYRGGEDCRRFEGKRLESRRLEGKRLEGKRLESRCFEGRRFESKQFESKRFKMASNTKESGGSVEWCRTMRSFESHTLTVEIRMKKVFLFY